MATKPTRNRPRGGSSAQGAGPSTATAGMVPFTAAAHEHTEIAFDKTVEFEEAVQQLGPFDVPAYGYMRHLLITVETSVAGSAEITNALDSPWNIFQNIQVNDVNGAPIFGPMDGFAALYCSIVGGYAGRPDPRVLTTYNGNIKEPKFTLRIPLEISHRDGFGSLANQNAAASYKVYLSLNTKAKVQASVGKATPKIRIRGWLEAWSLPNATDLAGRPQAEAPPMLDTAQYHSYYLKEVPLGNSTVLLVRVGSLIRNLIFIARNAAGERKDAVFPELTALEWDSRGIREDTQLMLLELMQASIPELKQRDEGVFCYPLDRSTKNTVGDDAPTLWYPTVQSTRLEIRGTNTLAGTLQIITNDVAPVAVNPQERYSEGGTGFTPEVGTGAGQVGTRSV